jgi:hypothetical protein
MQKVSLDLCKSVIASAQRYHCVYAKGIIASN